MSQYNLSARLSRFCQPCLVDDHLEVHGVISEVAGIVEDRERCKLGTVRRDVHLCLGLPEAGGGGGLWTESLDNIVFLVVVERHQGDYLLQYS